MPAHNNQLSEFLRTPLIVVIYNLILDKYAFALQVENDVMEAPSGKSIPRNSIVIADPDSLLKNNACVVICIDKSLPQITQLVQEGSRKYLKPQNPLYPVTELITTNYIICGVLRQVTFDL